MLSSKRPRRDLRPGLRLVPEGDNQAGIEVLEVARAIGITPLPWQEQAVEDMLLESAPGRWSSLESVLVVPRQNGKGAVLEIVVVGGLLVLGERLSLWSAHETKTAFEAFRRMDEILSSSSDVRRRVKKVSRSNGDEGFEFKNGSRLRFVARSKGSGRGFSADRLVLDEAQAIEAAQMDAMLPVLSTRPNPQVIYAGTPPLDGIGPAGTQLYQLRRRAEAKSPGLCYIDYGARPAGGGEPFDLEELHRVDLDDRSLWLSCNPSVGSLIRESFVESERMTLSDVGFARERLGIWPRQVGEENNGIVDMVQWGRLSDPKSAHQDRVVFAIDVCPSRSHSSVAAYSLREDGLGHVELVDYQKGTRWVVPRMLNLIEAWNPMAVILDDRGPAKSLVASLTKAGLNISSGAAPEWGDLVVTSTSDMGSACAQFVDAIRDEQIRHIGQPELDQALRNAKTRPLGDGLFGWGRKVSGVDVSPLVAATLARWGYETRTHLLQEVSLEESLGLV